MLKLGNLMIFQVQYDDINEHALLSTNQKARMTLSGGQI
jgi:hypothetical protein